MTNRRDLENRLDDLREPEADINNLPLASICLVIAADEVTDGPPGVLYLDGEPHRVGDISAAGLNF